MSGVYYRGGGWAYKQGWGRELKMEYLLFACRFQNGGDMTFFPY